MQYKYRFITHQRIVDSKEFDDLFTAIQYMNNHTNSTFGIIIAEIVNIHTDEVICSNRTVK